MKKKTIIKTALIGLLALSSVGLSACSSNTVKTYNNKTIKRNSDIITVKRAQKIMGRGFKNGMVKQQFQIVTDEPHNKQKQQKIINQVVFGGPNTVMQVLSQTKSGKKTQGFMAWLDPNNSYLQGRKNVMYTVNYNKLTGHSYADLADTIINNYNITQPDPVIKKTEKIEKKQNNVYELSATLTNKRIMKDTTSKIFQSLPQAPQQAKMLKFMAKQANYQEIIIKADLRGDRMLSYTEQVIAKLGKNNQITVSQQYSNFGGYPNLKLPDEAKSAKPLPKSKKN